MSKKPRIRITHGAYTGRVFTPDNVSCDQRAVQVWVGKTLEEFRLGFDFVWIVD